MLRSTRSATVVAIATAAALTVAGLFGGAAAFADDVPTPDPAATDVATPDESDAPAETPPPPKAGGAHNAQHREFAAADFVKSTASATSGNSFEHPVMVSGRWFSVDWDNTFATTQSGEPRKLGGGYYLRRTLWAKWKAPANGHISLAAWTGDTSDDLGINVYTGSVLTGLHRVGSNDEQYDPVDGAAGSSSGPNSNSEILSLKVTKGKTYYIQVGSATQFGSDSNASTDPFNDITMFVSGSNYSPSNDFFSSPTELKLGTGATVTTTVNINGSTIEEWEPTDNDEVAADVRIGSLWYKWTAPQDGSADLYTCSFLDSYTVAVFSNYNEDDGNGYGDLASWAFDEGNNAGCDFLSGGGAVNFSFEKGTTYYFQIGRLDGGINRAGDLTLTADFDEPYIEKVSPSSGSRLGGNTITITGQEFTSGGAPTVKIGGHTATIVGIPTNTQIKVKAPAHAPGTVEVKVTSGGDTSNIKHYKYL